MVEPVSSSIVLLAYVVSSLISSISNYTSGHFNREEAKIARWENFNFQLELEKLRQEMQITQMKLSVLHRQEDRVFQEKLAKESQEFQREIEEFRQTINLVINQKNIDFQKWQFEKQKELQLELLKLNQAFQRELNQIQHQNALEQIKIRLREERSPILNLAEDLLEVELVNGIEPLRILLSPPELDYDVNKPKGSGLRIETVLAEKIRQFLKHGYSNNSKERPTWLPDTSWRNHFQQEHLTSRILLNQIAS